jgi:NDP-mannose synthase
MSKRAIVLAGGQGTRLRPYTVVLPKPLMPLGEHPILEIIVRQLARFGFDRITLAVNHQADIIKAFFGDGSKWKIAIDYSLEAEPLSTIAPLRLIDDLPPDFLLMNGDVLTDLNIAKLFDDHVANKRLFTIAAAHRRHIADFGVLSVDATGRLTEFAEKPAMNYLVSMGVYVASRAILERVPARGKYGFDDLMLDLLRRGDRVQVLPYAGCWLDIGRPDDYLQALEEFERGRDRFLGEH